MTLKSQFDRDFKSDVSFYCHLLHMQQFDRHFHTVSVQFDGRNNSIVTLMSLTSWITLMTHFDRHFKTVVSFYCHLLHVSIAVFTPTSVRWSLSRTNVTGFAYDSDACRFDSAWISVVGRALYVFLVCCGCFDVVVCARHSAVWARSPVGGWMTYGTRVLPVGGTPSACGERRELTEMTDRRDEDGDRDRNYQWWCCRGEGCFEIFSDVRDSLLC